MNTTAKTQTGTIGNGNAVHAFRTAETVNGAVAFDLCGSSFYRNGRPQRKRVTGDDLSKVTCQKCLKALAA